MGADWYSMTCIGLKVPKEKVITEIEEYENSCSCLPQTPDTYPEAKYCRKCGRSIRRPIKVERPLFDIPEDYYNDKAEIKGWKVEHDTDACNFYICIFTSGHVEYSKLSSIPIITVGTLAKFKSDMESTGLWDEEQFGLWTITYCSY